MYSNMSKPIRIIVDFQLYTCPRLEMLLTIFIDAFYFGFPGKPIRYHMYVCSKYPPRVVFSTRKRIIFNSEKSFRFHSAKLSHTPVPKIVCTLLLS